MSFKFRSTVSRGKAEGEPMEAWIDGGCFVLFDPSKRRGGAVHSRDYTRVRSSEQAKRLIEEQGYSMRMCVRGVRRGASIIQASRIEIIDTSSEAGG